MYVPSDADLAVIVTHSNIIEGIDALPGDPLFDKHLAAAHFVRDVAPVRTIYPREIHAIMMAGLLDSAGSYRTCGMAVGSGDAVRLMPRAEYVPTLMERYEATLEFRLRAKSIAHAPDGGIVFHHEGLCIHPFEDGNGRTFRLQWNGVRLRCGLSWRTVSASNVRRYYRSIQDYEARVFIPEHVGVY